MYLKRLIDYCFIMKRQWWLIIELKVGTFTENLKTHWFNHTITWINTAALKNPICNRREWSHEMKYAWQYDQLKRWEVLFADSVLVTKLSLKITEYSGTIWESQRILLFTTENITTAAVVMHSCKNVCAVSFFAVCTSIIRKPVGYIN